MGQEIMVIINTNLEDKSIIYDDLIIYSLGNHGHNKI